ncbi:MAG: hypothetical protein D3903_15265 [Candidatus Electrothrix sp. GM3_4]|nr:hypothetical protein [Candidatus Electrothrix sp. GM3_4]
MKQIIFGLIFMIIGLFLIGWKVQQGYQLKKFMDWPTTSGEIINIDKYQETSSNGEGESVDYYSPIGQCNGNKFN